MRVAVVGHVESILFAVVPHMPMAGEIVHADETFEEPAGGGAVAAVQLAKLAGTATLYTALGDDEYGHRAEERLRELGLCVRVVWRQELQRRGFVHLDSNAERTISGGRSRAAAAARRPHRRLERRSVRDRGRAARQLGRHAPAGTGPRRL